MTNYRNDKNKNNKLQKWQVTKMTIYQNDKNKNKLQKWQIIKMTSSRNEM